MANVAERRKAALLDAVASLARARTGKNNVKAVEAFVRQFYARVPPDDILDVRAEDLCGAALSVWGLARRRRPGALKLNIFNPDPGKDGWSMPHTVIEIINDDMPFLVDTVTSEVNRQGHAVHLVIHPIVKVRRDGDGRMLGLAETSPGSEDGVSESFMHVQIDQIKDAAALKALRAGLTKVLGDVRVAVVDWHDMRQHIERVIAELTTSPPAEISPAEIAEGRAFLQWINDNHFTFLGYREYQTIGSGKAARMEAVKGAGLGLLRDPKIHVFEGVRQLAMLPEEVREFLHKPRLLIINKANRKSTVHRPVHLDAIGVKRFDKKGRVIGERLFVGLFTSAAYNRVPSDIPLLRRKVDDTIARAGFAPGSHDGKALFNILANFPRDELFQVSEEELFDITMGILHLHERQRVALFCRRDHFQRFVSCLVYIPRDRYSTELRVRFQAILEDTFGGPVTASDTQIAQDSPLGRVQYIVKTTPGKVPPYDVREVEKKLVAAAHTWADQHREALVAHHGEEAGLRLWRRFREAFPTAYREVFDARVAVMDIAHIEPALETGKLGMHLYRPDGTPETAVRFKIFNRGEPVALSDVLPVLEHMGFRVIAEVPFEIKVKDGGPLLIHDFNMVARDGGAIDIATVRDIFQEAFARVWTGEMEDDGFNRLVVGAELSWRDVVVIRAWSKYLRQIGVTFSQRYMEETLAENHALARLTVDVFHARFDPANEKTGEARAAKLLAEIERRLDAVASLDQDRIVRRFVNLVRAMVRTNFFQSDAEGAAKSPVSPKSYVSFKFDCALLDGLPAPRPFREIFVYSPRVEGVHLRFGKVARGGIRWSDRREDFRTEILGLVKAQQVKNAVIVPVGSKGGFVVKKPPASGNREDILKEGISCYKTLISGLLDLTDNYKGSRVMHPPRVVRKDDDDPYLVVAADKGTAAFSDIANDVAARYGFWLDDAFASGGSAGYDHKKMAITARGAWESVKRHFREINVDIQTQDFTVIGCGDMSGDVFGNGMLLSRHIKLVGAFNHLHIFVDPDPDPAASWSERKRVFDLPRSSWSDYDAKLISKGGGVFDRRAKSLAPSAAIKTLFGIERDKVTPNELIAAMLQAPVDLLWFGGIGTYVKARHESHAEVGDRANDSLRVDGRALRAKVVGEGANLAVTQRGRIEFALSGGRINTDAVDNSAGVDCSDHEVNIKILTGAVEAGGKLSRTQRNRLLETMTDEVAALVLRDNYLQTQSLSVTQSLGGRLLDRHALFMRGLEREGKLDRALEFLPDEETLTERKAAGLGLTRPELSVLLAYAKITVYDEILASDLPEDRYMIGDLRRYFPKPLQERYARQIDRHRLRREIIATAVTNSMVNRGGATFLNDVREKTGMAVGDIARAFTISRQIHDMRRIWADIEALDNTVPASLQAEMVVRCGRLFQRTTEWFLRHGGQPLDIAASIKAYGPGVKTLVDRLDAVIAESHGALVKERAAAFVMEGAPKALARRVASLTLLVPACDIVRIARDGRTDVERTARTYFAIGDGFGFDWLRRAASNLPIKTHWDKQAVEAIIDDLYGHQYEIAEKVLVGKGKAADAGAAIAAWTAGREAVYQRNHQLIEDLRNASGVGLAMLAVANRQLRALAAS